MSPTSPSSLFPAPKLKKLFSCSTQLNVNFYLLINSKLLVNMVVLLSLAYYKSIYAHEFENANSSWHFHIYHQRKSHAQLR